MTSLLFLLAALSSPAHAVDGHGQPMTPGQSGVHSPVATFNPWDLSKGSWGAHLQFELAGQSIGYQEVSGAVVDGGTSVQPYMTELRLANLSGSYAISDRFAVAAGLPLYLSHQDATSGTLQQVGPGLGDLRIWVPVALIRPDASGLGFGLSVVPHLSLPTANSVLRGKPLGGGAVAVLGYGLTSMRFAANLGLQAYNQSTDSDLDPALDALEDETALQGLLGLSASVEVRPELAITTELLYKPSLTSLEPALVSTAQNATDTAELIVSGSWHATDRSTLIIGGATSLNSGAGVPRARVFIGTRMGKRTNPSAQGLSPTLSAARTPYDLVLDVRDADGRAVEAQVTVLGGPAPITAQTDRKGRVILPLSEGAWEVEIQAEGYGSQARDLVLSPGRQSPPAVVAVMHSDQGTGSLALSLRDTEERGVDGASLSIDGQEYGTTGPGGSLQIDGLKEGEHSVSANAPGFEPGEARVIVATAQLGEDTALYLERPPGSVRVRVHDASGAPVSSAQVRFLGEGPSAPMVLDARGELLTQLDDGDWVVVVSSESHGLQQREIRIDTDRKVLQTVDVVLGDVMGQAELQLTILDPDGDPVQGAQVTLGGQLLGETGNGGTLSVGGLAPGPVSLQVSGERMQDEPSVELELVEGVRELLITMDWKPGTLQVVTRGKNETPIDAQVRFAGPEELPISEVGPDGEAWYSLPPGTWMVGVSAPAFGLQTREVNIAADETSLILISAVLREEKGESVLVLRVTDPKGRPVNRARVALDGEPIGTTSTGGSLRVEGLAPGESSVEVAGAMFHYESVDPLTLSEGENDVELALRWLDGTVTVRTSGPGGTPVDALVRAYGPVTLPPVRVGNSGERVLYLEPGGWTVVASSERMGIEQADVEVEAGQDALLPVTFTLSEAVADDNTLLLVLQDIDGNGIQGASVQLGQSSLTSPAGGSILVEGVQAGSVQLQVSAKGYKSLETQDLELVSGQQSRSYTLDFVPQPVQVQVLSADGDPLRATLTWVGPEGVEPLQTAADGGASFELRPGAWTLVAKAPEMGAKRAEIEILPGVAPETVRIELGESKVQVTSDQVVILEQVFFDTGRATIKAGSLPLLDEVANAMLLHPEILRVEIQGHTDDQGSDSTNQRLSQKRAQAVRDYLVSRGVDRKRLEANGYGAKEPVQDNATAQGRAANRRVQFEIVELETVELEE